MTRHVVHTHREQTPVRVEAGYDRPLRKLYLQVWDDPERHRPCDRSILYASHLDPKRDWSNIDSVVEVLDKLHVTVPDDLYKGLLEDQLLKRGHRIVQYQPVPLGSGS